MALDTYVAAKENAAALAAQVLARRMPPWPPAGGCNTYLHDRALGDEEIQTLSRWVELGAPEGDEASAPAAVSSKEPVIRHDVTLLPQAPYTPAPREGWTDVNRCFLLDPKLEVDGQVVGYEVKPGNRGMVHHAMLYVVEDQTLQEEMASADALDSQPGFDCADGFTDTSTLRWVGGWSPGETATRLPHGLGISLPKSAKVRMEIHYNIVNGKAPDLTEVYFELATDLRIATTLAVENIPGFTVPAGEGTSVESRWVNTGSAMTVYAVFPHMHLLGTTIGVEVIRANDASSHCLVNVPRWDYRWQQFYFFEQPVTVATGDSVRLRCTYVNTSAEEVFAGWRSADEMCTWMLLVGSP